MRLRYATYLAIAIGVIILAAALAFALIQSA